MPHTRAVLRQLLDQRPRMTLRVVSLNFADHLAALVRQEVDVMFLRPPVPAGIEVRHLATEPRVACLSADDPLAALPSVSLAQLAGRPVVAMPAEVPGCGGLLGGGPAPRRQHRAVRAGSHRHGGPAARRGRGRGDVFLRQPPATCSPAPASATSTSPISPPAVPPWPGLPSAATNPPSPPYARQRAPFWADSDAHHAVRAAALGAVIHGQRDPLCGASSRRPRVRAGRHHTSGACRARQCARPANHRPRTLGSAQRPLPPSRRTRMVLVPAFSCGTGTLMVRTPSLYSAVASWPVAPAGRRTERAKVP